MGKNLCSPRKADPSPEFDIVRVIFPDVDLEGGRLFKSGAIVFVFIGVCLRR